MGAAGTAGTAGRGRTGAQGLGRGRWAQTGLASIPSLALLFVVYIGSIYICINVYISKFLHLRPIFLRAFGFAFNFLMGKCAPSKTP